MNPIRITLLFMSFIVYILYDIDRYYIGYTSDEIEERLRRHLSDHFGFTTRSKEWKVVYKENFNNKADAVKREKEIKNWKSKKRIELLLEKR